MKLVGQTARRMNVIYLAPDSRESKLARGAFDKSHPHLTLDFTSDANDVRRRLREQESGDALLIGWSVAEPDALALIAHVRQQAIPIAIVAAGDHGLERYAQAGADECLARGASFLARLPDAIEVAISKHQMAAARAPEASTETARPLRVAYAGDVQFLKGALGADRSLQITALAQALPDLTAGRSAFDVVVLDHSARDANTAGALTELKRLERPLPIVLLVDPPDETTALRTFDQNIEECLVKTPGWTARLGLRLGIVCTRFRQLRELEALRQREARLRTMVDRLPACVVRLSDDGAILAMNAVALDLVGATEPKQILRKPFQALVGPDSIDACTDFVRRVADDETRSIELSLITLTGAARLVEATAVPLAPEDGRPASVLMVLRNITEWKRLEAALEEETQVATGAPTPVVEPTSISEPAFAVSTGPDAPSPVAPAPTAPAPAAPAPVDPAQLRAMEADLTRLCRTAHTTFQSLEDALRAAEVQHDTVLALQQEAFAALQAADQERWRSYETFVAAAHFGIAQLDERGALVDANPAFVQALGYTSADTLIAAAAQPRTVTEPDTWARAVDSWRAGATDPVETRWKHADGSLVVLRLTGRLRRGTDGAEPRLELVAENLTALRALEARGRRARRWEDLARQATALAGDLRGAIEDMRESARRVSGDTTLDPAAREQVVALEASVARAADLSRQLAAFGRRGARVAESLDVNAVARALEDILRRLMAEDIELSFELVPQREVVEGERAALEETLVALAVGAGDVLPAGGHAVIATGSAEITSHGSLAHGDLAPGDYVTVSLTARGWGASPAAADASAGVISARRALARLGGALVVERVSDESLIFKGYLPQASVSILADDARTAGPVAAEV